MDPSAYTASDAEYVGENDADDADDSDSMDVVANLFDRRAAIRHCRAPEHARLRRSRGLMYLGVVPRRRANKELEFHAALWSIQKDYFGVDCKQAVYDERDSECRLLVPRVVFMRTYVEIMEQPSV